MSADSKNVRDTFADQLSSFDDRLHSTVDDVDMLADIQDGIGRLLSASGNSEADIRKILQERFDAGELRKETFQLVKSLLDRFITENIPTSPTQTASEPAPGPRPVIPAVSEEQQGDDSFGATTVIPVDLMPKISAEGRVQVGSVLRDRFLLQERVSGGSMGVVYKALDRRLAETGSEDHWVAIKVLSPQLAENGQALRALQQEAAKGRCLVHQNIVQFIDLDRDDDLYFLIMEWLEGQTLADILDSKDASVIDLAAAFRIVRQVGAALEYAHSRGIVHADIKPGNIMIMPNGDAKLFDFGVARVRQQHSDVDFDPGVLGGVTPAYSSMQVLTSEDPVAADDVFSLSCLLYRLIAGYRVFGPRNAAEASQEGMKPQRLKDLNDSQWRALKKGLAYSRVTRFASVREFLDALDQHQDEPFCVEEPDRFPEVTEESASTRWLLFLFAAAVLGSAAAYQYGYLDPLLARFAAQDSVSPSVTVEGAGPTTEQVLEQEVTEEADSLLPIAGPVLEETVAESVPVAEDAADQTAVFMNEEVATESPALEALTEPVVDTTPVVGPDSMLVDFSALPPPTEIVPFTPGGRAGRPVNIAVREDGDEVVIDFIRGSGLSTPITLRLEEVGFSGNRSPWSAGQYALSNSGQIHFPAGQARGRVSLVMASDTIREADQQSTLRLRDAEFAGSELALLNVTLEDDDQRSYEARIPADTVAFSARQITIRESDPAVQIDLVRFNPANVPVDVEFSVRDITATEGEDYFAPGAYSISFGPGQRSARLLIPLVQDASIEGDETFVVELVEDVGTAAIGLERSIVVLIRDDESQSP